jgi:hypothetical protein
MGYDELGFDGCDERTVLNALRVVSVTERAFVGSGIERFAGGEWPAECRDALENISTPIGPLEQVVWRGGAERLELTSMTRLTVLGRSLRMTVEQRRFLVEIDLSAFDRLPVDSTLADSWSLKTIRFSRNLMAIPDDFLAGCRRLVDVNSGDCQSLKTIGVWAFERCWKLKELGIPQSCSEVDVCSSGISALDLRWSRATEINADGCIHMRKLCLPNRIRCVFFAGPARRRCTFP